MKYVIGFIVGVMLGGGALVALELPTPGYDQCDIIEVKVERAEPTFIDPDPPATGMLLIEYCGQRMPNSSGSGYHNERATKYVDVDVDQAEIIVEGAQDLLNDGEVYLP